MLLAPAREFLLNPQVTGQTIARKVQFLQSKLFLNDQDLEEAFKQIGDPAGPKYFSTKRISTGVKFLTNPQLASKPMDVKVKYLKDKIGLSQEEVTQAFKMKDNLEKAAKAKENAKEGEAGKKQAQPLTLALVVSLEEAVCDTGIPASTAGMPGAGFFGTGPSPTLWSSGLGGSLVC